jgi:glycerophosphoryl diester phosphodiesterase
VTATNPWLDRRVLVYAHQGGAREGPSSTLFAMRQALAAGAHALELDVHATADGHLVVCHDATVDRTTDGEGAIAEMTLAELVALDNAYWFVPNEVVAPGRPDADYLHRGKAPVDLDFGIAPLEAVLQMFPGVYLNLDIKQTAPVVAPYEQALADLLRRYGRTDDVIVASFWDVATDEFRRVCPEIPTSAGTLATAAFWEAVQNDTAAPDLPHVALQVPPTFQEHTIVDERFVARAHDAGLAVHVWTIDDPDEARRLVALGVDAVITDVPRLISSVL